MPPHRQFLAFVVLLLQTAVLGAAQQYSEKVWGIFAYTLSGENTPSVLVQRQQPAELSAYGANQLAAAGSTFGDRYLPSGGTNKSSKYAIQSISASNLHSEDLAVFTKTEQYNIGSAQAFMQGLYPPISKLKDPLANGTSSNYPLNGYQYPRIITLGDTDPQSLIVSGSASCNMHRIAMSEYGDSSEAQKITRESEAFYADIWPKYLSRVYPQHAATYTNAVGISEYMEYEAVHNSTMSGNVTGNELHQARWLADQYTYATNSQSDFSAGQSTIGASTPIAGQTLAASILQAFNANIDSSGVHQKMTLLFGDADPAVALASLLGLASEQHTNFYSRPVQGASLVFELYSLETVDASSVKYPSQENLYVRFLLHNGTDSSTEFTPFPLFGYGPSRTYMTYSEFKSELEAFAVRSLRDWCLRCNSDSIFCTGVYKHGNPKPEQKKGMAPAVAGVIGAVVTLVVIAILTAIGFLLCGFCKRGVRKPSLGGFKGDSKLASDTDLSFRNPIWGASKPATTEQDDGPPEGGIVVRGHERLGSWEMGQGGKEIGDAGASPTNRSGLVDLDDTIPCGLQPVKIRETV